MGADEFYFHLYETGDVIPGGSIDINVAGMAGSVATLALGFGIRSQPLPTLYGDLYLEFPLPYVANLGSIPGNGILSRAVTIPTWWVSGKQSPFQALAGWKLTNLMVLEVE